jgi:hypothetical protein
MEDAPDPYTLSPIDYTEMPLRLIEQCNPAQKQLLGAISDTSSYYIPREEDTPIKVLVSD